MTESYRDYLATEVLNEGHIVSYRMLSRALSVHHNLAKQMLFEFHETQNARKPRSVHATYLLAGIRRPPALPTTNGTNGHDGTDVCMESSPFPSSAVEPAALAETGVPTTTVALARDEDLAAAKLHFQEIRSIHVYCLAPTGLRDRAMISTCHDAVTARDSREDPLTARVPYGTIQNPAVIRRSATRPPPSVAAAGSLTAPVATANAPSPLTPADGPGTTNRRRGSASERAASNTSTPPSSTPVTSSKRGDGKAAPGRRGKVDILKAFAKSKPPTATPVAPDGPMADAEEDEQEDDLALAPPPDGGEGHRQHKAAREESLRQMMDEEDEPMVDAAEESAPDGAEDTADAESAAPIDRPPSRPAPDTHEDTVTVSDGRRRGRRRVMKKTTVTDEEGFFVTKEEPAWESFSDDEPEPKKAKGAPSSAPTKGGKAAGPRGQGNIMSFFTKR